MKYSRIYLGGDHAGFDYKAEIVKYLTERGLQVKDFGPFSTDAVDYPDFAHQVGRATNDDPKALGILVCGSGNGVAMTANKYLKNRAALCWLPEIAALARQHNNANVLCMPARFMTLEQAITTVEAFLVTEFEGGRHATRVQKI